MICYQSMRGGRVLICIANNVNILSFVFESQDSRSCEVISCGLTLNVVYLY